MLPQLLFVGFTGSGSVVSSTPLNTVNGSIVMSRRSSSSMISNSSFRDTGSFLGSSFIFVLSFYHDLPGYAPGHFCLLAAHPYVVLMRTSLRFSASFRSFHTKFKVSFICSFCVGQGRSPVRIRGNGQQTPWHTGT